jgi:hypothetical protein
MSFRILLFFTLLSLAHASCEKATKEELSAIESLNREFTNFEFSTDDDPVGIYLHVRIVKETWDSAELKKIYDSSVGSFKHKPGVSWAYLSVHDRNEKYLFTISKDEIGSYFFFTE